MTRRERVMSMCVGGMAIGLGLVWGVQKFAVDPIRDAYEQIEDEKKTRRDLKKELKELKTVDEIWQAATARTFSPNKDDAQLLFQVRIEQLLAMHDMIGDKQTGDTKISPGAISTDAAGFSKVPVSITTNGTLKQVVGFLCDFYREPYAARIDSLTLTADKGILTEAVGKARPGTRRTGSKSRSRSRSRTAAKPTIGPDGPVLRVSITATTLVVPTLEDIDPEYLPAELEPLEGGELVHSREKYNEIIDNSLFKPFKKKVAVVTPPVTKTVKPPVVEPVKPPVQTVTPVVVNLRPNAGSMFLRIVTAIHEEPRAYVYNDAEPTKGPTVFLHDTEIPEEGFVMLIHRRGMVVRATENGVERDYFYPLGASFLEREVLTPDTHPEIWEALLREFAAVSPEPDPEPRS